MMGQNRKPPAYIEYAATVLADRNFRLMSLTERGLLYTLKLECWQNSRLPANEADLAKYLGCDLSEIKSALTPHLKTFFKQDVEMIYSPELEDYRQYLKERREKQSQGGKLGAAIKNIKPTQIRDKSHTINLANPQGNFQVPQKGSRRSLVQLKSVKPSQNQSLESDVIQDQWIKDYDKASNGE